MSDLRTNALAGAASAVAVAFTLALLDRWLLRRRRHELAWTVALGLFAVGSLALLLGAAAGWTTTSFRAFYLFGAVLNVPVLALGTIYLLTSRRTGDRVAAVTCLALAFAAGVVVAAPIHGIIRADELPKGSDVFGAGPRIAAGVASGVGALVVLGGALWSAARLARGRGHRRVVGGNLLIALGVLVLSAGGLLNSALGEMDAFAVSLAVGVVVLFVGFLVATPTATP